MVCLISAVLSCILVFSVWLFGGQRVNLHSFDDSNQQKVVGLQIKIIRFDEGRGVKDVLNTRKIYYGLRYERP